MCLDEQGEGFSGPNTMLFAPEAQASLKTQALCLAVHINAARCELLITYNIRICTTYQSSSHMRYEHHQVLCLQTQFRVRLWQSVWCLVTSYNTILAVL